MFEAIKQKIIDFKSKSVPDKIYCVIVLLWDLVVTVWTGSHFMYYLRLCFSSYDIYLRGMQLTTVYLILIETLLIWVFLIIIPIKIVAVLQGMWLRILDVFKKPGDSPNT